MFSFNRSQIPIFRILLIYALLCLLLLELYNLSAQTLSLPPQSRFWLQIAMLSVAPLVVFVAGLMSVRNPPAEEQAGTAEVATQFQIGHALVDISSRQLRFHNEIVEVQPKVFDLLVYLIQQRHRAVNKEELFDVIWPEVVVSESSLTQTVKRARDLFRGQGFSQDIIRTVSRKGYQFDHPVEEISHRIVTAPSPWWNAALPTLTTSVPAILTIALLVHLNQKAPSAAPPVIEQQSLAVLPFVNLSDDGEFGYFSAGLTETVTHSLTRLKDFKVIAPNSAFTVNPDSGKFSDIGEQLGVSHIILGSVQRDGPQLRISARLINTQNGTQIWSQLFQRSFDGIFMLHDEISQAIMVQLAELFAVNMPPPTPLTISHSRQDSEAYRLVLKGKTLRRDSRSADLEKAEALFRQALALRPDYPLALVALAETVRVRATFGEIPREPGFSESLSLLQQAISIDPAYGEAYVQRAEIEHRHLWDFEKARQSYKLALSANPGSASAHSAYSRFLSNAGRYQQAVKQARIAIELDPLSSTAASSLAIRLIRARLLEEARQRLDTFKTLHPENANVPWLEANWHIRAGHYTESLHWIALEDLDYLRLSLNAIALHYLGRTGQAEDALNELITTDAQGAAFQIAEVYAHWQQTDTAFEWLERAFLQGDPGLTELYSSVNLENLYSDPRFFVLARRVGLPPAPAALTASLTHTE